MVPEIADAFLRLRETRNSFQFACVLLVLIFLPALLGISGNSEQKIILQTIGS